MLTISDKSPQPAALRGERMSSHAQVGATLRRCDGEHPNCTRCYRIERAGRTDLRFARTSSSNIAPRQKLVCGVDAVWVYVDPVDLAGAQSQSGGQGQAR